jgi:hypothetical protein
MAKKAPSFNFGFNRKPRAKKKKTSGGKKRSAGSKSNAWRKYAGSSAPIPD